jgi:hypothetical protein
MPLRVTPGAGLRIVIPRFAPIRLDVAYNRYDLQEGPLFYTTSQAQGGDLVLLQQRFVKPRPSKFTFHFAFGYAY